ncbi:MAG: hypothetical protein OZ928_18655 [Polyangiaceae bacterium]|nr:hypothetical protein [Polyangiaceae bacterium]
MKRRGGLVTVSGVDCAGKTTQIELLARALERDGYRTRVLWYRPGYSARLDRLRRAVRRLRPGALPRATASGARERAFARPGVSQAWLAMALGDLLIEYAAVVRGRVLAGEVVICDRYLFDAGLDLTFRFPALEGSSRRALGAAARVCPRPDAELLLLLPEAEMLRRMELKNEPFPDPPEIRARRYAAYAERARAPWVTPIDSAREIAAVHAELHRVVSEALGRRGRSAR